MSDGSLSQDEIEALLQGADDAFSSNSTPVVSSGDGGGSLSESQKATFMEIVNMVSENHASGLSAISTKTAKISGNDLSVGSPDDLKAKITGPVIEAKISYTGAVNGSVYFYIPETEAAKIAGLMIGQEETELNEMAIEALTEAYSQMTGSADTAISSKYGGDFNAATPALSQKADASAVAVNANELAIVSSQITVEESFENITYIMAFEMPLVQGFLGMVTGGSGADAGAADAGGAGDLDSLLGGGGGGMDQLNVQQADFGQLNPAGEVSSNGNIGLLMDVTMKMTVELGRTTMTIRDILALGEGSIIELDKLAGEPVDLLVNNKLIARGEVVVIDENFGVRVTDIVNPKERVTSSNTY